MDPKKKYPYCDTVRKYTDSSVKKRIERLFLDNIGKIVTRDHIIEAAKNPETGLVPENWHQRLSELRCDSGYTILTSRDTADLKVSEYLMLSSEKRSLAGKRVMPTPATWQAVLTSAGNKCQWTEGGYVCGLAEGDIDPIGGGTVRLTPDHKTPHSVNPNSDPNDPNHWQALCGRHQVVKKNYWGPDGKLHTEAILQALSKEEKLKALDFLNRFFNKGA